MAGTIKAQQQSASTTLQDGTSSALANGAVVAAATSNWDNSSNLCFVSGFELNTGFSVSPTVGVGIELYLVPALDGTNFGDFDTSTPNVQLTTFTITFGVVFSQTAAQRLVATGIALMARLYKAYVYNKSGQSMAAGWTVKIFTDYAQYT